MTTTAIDLRPIAQPISGFDNLAKEASAEGHAFVARMVNEWRSGAIWRAGISKSDLLAPQRSRAHLSLMSTPRDR